MLGHSPLSVFPLSAFDESIRTWFRATTTVASNPSYVLYFSTKETILGADDVPANTPIEGVLIKALDFQRSIIGGEYGIGRFQSGFGTMEIIAADGTKDDLFDRYRPDGGRVALYIKDDDGRFADAYLAFSGVGVRWAITRDVGTVDVKDNSYKLDVPARRSVYAGTGGLEGGTELAGKPRPWPLGYTPNIPGTLVIPNEKLYDLCDGRIQAVTACRDTGAALTFSADYATTALLRAASISGSYYATCLAEGRARVGGSPSSEIRWDVQGDKVGGTFVSSTADIVRRLIDAATTMNVSTDLVGETFDWVNEIQPADVGYYISSESNWTVLEVIEKLMDAIGGWAGCRAQGKFEIGVLLAPDADDVPPFIYREDEGDFLSIDRQSLPEFLHPPPTSWRIGYDRNWAPQDTIAGTVAETDPDLAAWLGLESRYASPSTPRALPSGTKPKIATVEGYFRYEADAVAEANRRDALWSQNFNLYVYEVKDHVFLHEIGRAPKLEHSRFGLSAGRPIRTVSINDNSDDRKVTLIGLG